MKNKNSDVIIIGGGIIGLASAYYLVKEGKSVIILEKGTPEEASSHANCGLVSPSHAMPLNSLNLIFKALKWLVKKDSPFYIKPQWNIGFWYWMLAFALNARGGITEKNKIGKNNLLMSSRGLFDELIKESGINCNWLNKGVMFAFLSKKAFDNHGKLNKKLEDFNSSLKATPFIGDELRKKEPAFNAQVYGGWLYPIDAYLKPDELIMELKKVLIAKGVKIIAQAEVKSFEKGTSSILGVKTEVGYFTANKYVLAAGAWTPALTAQVGIKLSVLPGKGYSITMKSPSISPQIPCLLVEKKVVATPFENSYRLGGTMEFSGFDDTINRNRIDALKNAAKLYLKKPYSTEIENEWFGYRPMTSNDLPIIDFVPQYKNLMVATGHNMVGISMATGTGKLVAELIAGKKPHIDPSYYKIKSNIN